MIDQLPEFIEVNGTKRATHNSEGRPIHPDPEAIHAFWEWFGNSKAVDKKGRPLVLYHGTGSLENCDVFKPEMTGLGNDQIGSGFYFTSDRVEASGYANDVTPNVSAGTPKLGGHDSPGVLPVYLAITNPITVMGDSLRDGDLELTTNMAYQLMLHAENIFDMDESPLVDWFDLSRERSITHAMIRKVAKEYAGNRLVQIENDFFRDNATRFRQALRDVSGHNGALILHDGGERFGSKMHVVAWFPEQIKSALGNSGRFVANAPDLTDYVAPEPEPTRKPRLR